MTRKIKTIKIVSKENLNKPLVVYVVIGGPPVYHLEDEKIQNIYGIFTTRKQAEQTYNAFESSCGHLYLLEVPIDRKPCSYGDGLNISLHSNEMPETGFNVEKGREFEEVYMVVFQPRKSSKNILYKVCSDEKDAESAKKILDPPDLESYKESLYWGEYKVFKYWIRDLSSWGIDESFIDKDIEPIEYEKSPMWFSRA
jgi:hypothetical protein